jgi:mono/diheme cytochrome c family protein
MSHAKWRVSKRAALFAALLLFPFALMSDISAHEPITTKVRFNKEMVRILERNCLGCHRPGGIAPMSLAKYEEARPWAKAIKEEMLEKRMPPWHAVKGYGEFRNAPLLTQREIDLIVNWVEGGAPKGDDKDLPAGPLYSDDWTAGAPDLVLKPESARSVASDADERVSFTLPAGLKEDRWLRAIDLKPGNGSVVHCATFYGEERGKPAPGPVLGTWVPGQRTVALPSGTAHLLPAGSRIVVKVHYRGAGEQTSDLSEIGLYFAKSQPRKQAREVAITSPDAVIPAGAKPHRIAASFTAQEDTEAVAIRPRAHPLVVSLQVTAHRPDGAEEVMIWTRGYRYDWQPTYYFKRPVALPKGTRVEVIAYFDNSEDNPNNPDSPPRQARWADLTPDPLCALIVATPRPGQD